MRHFDFLLAPQLCQKYFGRNHSIVSTTCATELRRFTRFVGNILPIFAVTDRDLLTQWRSVISLCSIMLPHSTSHSQQQCAHTQI